MNIEQAKQTIALWFDRVYKRGLTTSSGGNLSIKLGDTLVISPSGGDKGALKPEDCAVVNLVTGEHIEGLPPSCELPMHTAVYAARPDINCIMHAHPPYICAFAVTQAALRTDLFAEDYLLVPHLGVADYHTPSSEDLAQAAATAAKDAQAVLLLRHGVMTFGDTMAQCFARLECLEHTAQVQWLTHGRKDVSWLDDAQKADIDARFRKE